MSIIIIKFKARYSWCLTLKIWFLAETLDDDCFRFCWSFLNVKWGCLRIGPCGLVQQLTVNLNFENFVGNYVKLLESSQVLFLNVQHFWFQKILNWWKPNFLSIIYISTLYLFKLSTKHKKSTFLFQF